MTITLFLILLFVVTVTILYHPCSPTYAKSDKCDSSYPDVCISSPSPDLNCSDISYKDFKVLPPDPHGFDKEGDGIGCESESSP
jgi:micrococcal nuclease